MTRVFLSPSDQDNNAVAGGGNEQQYATIRCEAAARVLRTHGVEVKISEAGRGDDSRGFLASVAEGNAWGADLYFADHTNATGTTRKLSGVQMYVWPSNPASVSLGTCIAKRLDPIVPGGWQIMNGTHLGEVRGPRMTAVLGESGYHDNPVDAAVIRERAVEMGVAIGYGILDHLGIAVNTSSTPEQRDTINRQLLVVDGVLGPRTYRALQLITGATPDGVWGPETRRALQRWLGVTQDGIIGRQTVMALQKRVKAPVDGIWGRETTRALQAWINKQP